MHRMIYWMNDMNRQRRLDAQRQRTIAWLGSKAPQGMNCPICGQMSWNIGEMVELRPFEGGNLTIGNSAGIYPSMPVVCNNCAYTMLINAVSSGILQIDDFGPEVNDD